MYEHAKKLMGTHLRIYIAIKFLGQVQLCVEAWWFNGITLINLIVTLFDYILTSS